MKIKKYKFQEGDVLPAPLNSETEESVTEKVNEFNDKWFNSKRQNIGLNAFYNKQADEYNEDFDRFGWSKEKGTYEKPFVPVVKSPKGNIDEVGEFVKAPGDDRLLTPNPRYVKSILGKAKSNLSDFNKNVTDTKVDFEEMDNMIGYYKKKNNNTVKVDSRISDDDKVDTAIHESAHRLSGYDNTKTGWNKNQYNYEYFVDSAEDGDPYYGSKDEQYARVHQARKELNLDPNTIYTKKEIQDKIDSYVPGSIHKKVMTQDNLFNRYSIEKLTDMFNNSFKKGGKFQEGGDLKLPEEPKHPTLNNSTEYAQGWTKNWYKSRPNLGYRTMYNEVVDRENEDRTESFSKSYRKLDPLPIVGHVTGTEKTSAKTFKDDSGLNIQNPFYNKKYDEKANQRLDDFYKLLDTKPTYLKTKTGTDATTASYTPSKDIMTVRPGRRKAWPNALVHEWGHRASIYNDEEGNKFRSNFFSDTDAAMDKIESRGGNQYWDGPHEQYARLMQTRAAMGADSKKIYTPEEADKKIMDLFNSGDYSDWNADAIILNSTNPEKFARQLNTSW